MFGVNVPAGRSTITVYPAAAPINAITNYNMTDGLGWTYRYYKGAMLIPFGFGLTYTTFEYSNLQLSATSIGPCSCRDRS